MSGQRPTIEFTDFVIKKSKDMKRIFFLCAVAITFIAFTAAAQTQQFSFGGFTLNSSTDQLKRSFPHSTVEVNQNSTYVRIAKEDIQDGVTSGVIFMHNTKPHVAQMIFEMARDPNKPDSYYRNPFNQNPRCEPILAELNKRHGKPYGPFDNSEEGLAYKEYVWDNDQEKLILVCARFADSKNKKLWAAAVKIGANRPGACMHDSCIEAPK